MRNLILRISFAVLACVLVLAPLQAKSDFSGTWQGNISKSDFGPAPTPDSIVLKIDHQDPSLKMNLVQKGGGNGDMNYDMVYTTDGKESVNHLMDNEFKSTVNWENDDLVMDTKGSFDGNDFTSKERWTLSDGGKTLTLNRTINTSGGDFTMKLVFEKQ